MIGVDLKGDFIVDGFGHLQLAANPTWQTIAAECRCEQQTYFADLNFGRNPLIWKLSNEPKDRVSDLTRIGNKYTTIRSCFYDEGTRRYVLQ
jgi:hypothetical protein